MKSQRFLAFLIDLIILNAVIGLLGLLINTKVSLYKMVTGEASIDVKLTFDLFYYLIYFVFFDVFKDGITVGKRATGLFIINQAGQIPERNDLVKRTFLKMIGVIFLPIAALVYLIGEWAIQDATTDMKVVQGKS